jgi:SAM-dependent methyltransferase
VLRSIAVRAGSRSREEKWRLYERLYPPRRGERVLDVGASTLTSIARENWFLRRYPYPEQVTAVVLERPEVVRQAFPRITVIVADGRALPFAERAFDVVHSNAVIEHVGPRTDQQRFMLELVRVGQRGFVTTPNRWFPVESHSQLLFVHWLPRKVAWWTQNKLGHSEADAWLLGPTSFGALAREALVEPKLYRQRMLGLTATLVLVYDRR